MVKAFYGSDNEDDADDADDTASGARDAAAKLNGSHVGGIDDTDLGGTDVDEARQLRRACRRVAAQQTRCGNQVEAFDELLLEHRQGTPAYVCVCVFIAI